MRSTRRSLTVFVVVAFSVLAGCLSDWSAPPMKRRADAPRDEDTVIIRGVIAHGGELDGGLKAKGEVGDDAWLTSLDLKPWRTAEGTLEKSSLRGWFLCSSDAELHRMMKRSPKKGACVELRVSKLRRMPGMERELGDSERELVEFRGRCDDRELFEVARQLSPPETLSSAVFGTLELNPSLPNYYEGKRSFPRGGNYEVAIDIGDPANASAVIGNAETAALRVEETLPVIWLATAGMLVELYNESWNDGEPLTVLQIAPKLEFQSFTYDGSGGGAAELYFDDGGLFLGHSIVVRLNPDGTVGGVDLAG